MDIYLEHRDHLAPDDALFIRLVKNHSIGSPHQLMTLQSRSTRPLAPSKAPLPRTSFSSDLKYAHRSLSRPPRLSTSSSTSIAPSVTSSATSYSYSTAPSSPTSLISRLSPPSSQSQLQLKLSHRPVFRGLPPEIYDCVLQQLRRSHEDSTSQSCQTCHLRDLCSLALTSRAWDKAVVKRM